MANSARSFPGDLTVLSAFAMLKEVEFCQFLEVFPVKHQNKQSAFVFLGCCLVYAAITGIGINCRGIFYGPAAEELQVSMTTLTTFSTYYGITAAICMPFFCRLFEKVPARISMTLAVLIFVGAEFFMGSVETVRHFHILGAVQGISGGFLTFYPVQTMIGNWFPGKKGTMLGLTMMFCGLAGMVANPIVSRWITAMGWRAAFRMVAVVIIVLALPAALLMLRRAPEGFVTPEKPAGEKGRGLSAVKGKLICLFLILALLGLPCSLPQHLPNLANSLGLSAAFGATMVSCAMAGNLVGKVILGPLNDRLGPQTTTAIAVLPVIATCVLLTSVTGQVLLVICAFLVGLLTSAVAMQIPLLFRVGLSPEIYQTIFPTVCMVNILITSFSHTIVSMGYDLWGGYPKVLLLSAAGLALCAAIALGLQLHGKKAK